MSSDNKYNPEIPSKFTSFGPKSKLPAAQQERNHRIFKAALHGSKYNPENEALDEAARIMRKAQDVSLKVQAAVKPILEAGGWKDKEAIGSMMSALFIQAFDTRLLFSREDLVLLCTVLHVGAMMQSIEADPTLSGKPDLLAGL